LRRAEYKNKGAKKPEKAQEEQELKPLDWRELLMFRMMRLARRVHINRIILVSTSTHLFTEYFKGFEKVDAVRRIFGEETEEVLSSLKVDFTWAGYMGVNPSNGHVMVNSNYLNNGNRIDVYLDVIHELSHVKQRMDGKELFDSHYSYTERPTEVEAYRHAVEEAKRLGLKDERICQYLKTEWMSNTDLKRLAKTLGVNCGD
jgi:hypothetical protein